MSRSFTEQLLAEQIRKEKYDQITAAKREDLLKKVGLDFANDVKMKCEEFEVKLQRASGNPSRLDNVDVEKILRNLTIFDTMKARRAYLLGKRSGATPAATSGEDAEDPFEKGMDAFLKTLREVDAAARPLSPRNCGKITRSRSKHREIAKLGEWPRCRHDSRT